MAGVNIYTHILQVNVKKYATPFYLSARITVARNAVPSVPFLIYKHYKLLFTANFHFKMQENRWCSCLNY